MNRRTFMKTAGLGALAYSALPTIEWAWGDIPSRTGNFITGRKLNIAGIGVGFHCLNSEANLKTSDNLRTLQHNNTI